MTDASSFVWGIRGPSGYIKDPPITLSYERPNGVRFYTEPHRFEWKEGGLVMHFKFNVSEAFTTSMVELRINDVVRVYNPAPHSTLVDGDTFLVAIMLPY